MTSSHVQLHNSLTSCRAFGWPLWIILAVGWKWASLGWTGMTFYGMFLLFSPVWMGASIVSSDAETHAVPFSSNGDGEEK